LVSEIGILKENMTLQDLHCNPISRMTFPSYFIDRELIIVITIAGLNSES